MQRATSWALPWMIGQPKPSARPEAQRVERESSGSVVKPPWKGFACPIIHVNADDVAGCISAVRLAFAFRQEFGHDVVIDLIGYRRFGHNEADEPAYTQPEMYAKIKNKKRATEIWAEKLVDAGVVTQE